MVQAHKTTSTSVSSLQGTCTSVRPAAKVWGPVTHSPLLSLDSWLREFRAAVHHNVVERVNLRNSNARHRTWGAGPPCPLQWLLPGRSMSSSSWTLLWRRHLRTLMKVTLRRLHWRSFLATWGILRFHASFRIGFFTSVKKCMYHWDLDRDCVDSIDCFGSVGILKTLSLFYTGCLPIYCGFHFLQCFVVFSAENLSAPQLVRYPSILFFLTLK